MLIYDSNKPCVAISYESATYNDLRFFLKTEHNVDLLRITPEDFFQSSNTDCQYINLISNNMMLREKITNLIDSQQLSRFSFIHPKASVSSEILPAGIFVYPNCTIYTGVELKNDIIVHAHSLIAHNIVVSTGTYFSGGVVVGGSTQIGQFCWIGLNVTIYDKLTITDHVTIAARAVIKHDLIEPATYGTVFLTKKLDCQVDIE